MPRRQPHDNACEDCGTAISRDATRCRSCAARNRGQPDARRRAAGERLVAKAADVTRQMEKHAKEIERLSAQRRELWRRAVDEYGLSGEQVRGSCSASPFWEALARARREHAA